MRAAYPIKLSELNHKQRLAIESFKGPQVIIAGPGSGKTLVVSHLIGYLIAKKGIAPEGILTLTFSQSAAAELRQRVDSLLGQSYGKLWIGTFHSFCSHLLKENSMAAGLTAGFKVLSKFGEWLILGEILRRDKSSGISYKPGLTKKLLEFINLLKQNLIDLLSLEEVLSQFSVTDSPFLQLRKKLTPLSSLFSSYQKALQRGACLGFSDLIARAIALLTNNEALLQRFTQQFQYILVDEFQDTDPAQFKLLQLLAGEDSERKICVVGDPNQSIYRFRGSDVNNLLHREGEKSQFQKIFPNAKVVFLQQSYRAYEELVEIWERLNLGSNITAIRGKKNEPLVTIASEPTPLDEAFFIARQIKEMVLEERGKDAKSTMIGYSYKDFAILLRSTKNQAAPLEETLSYYHIPYRVIGQSNFHRYPAVSFIAYYLKALAREDDDNSFSRLLNSSEIKLDKSFLHRLEDMVQAEGGGLQEGTIGFVMRLSLDYPEDFPFNSLDHHKLPKRRPALIGNLIEDERGRIFLKKLYLFVKTFLWLREIKDKMPLRDFIHRLLNHTVFSMRAGDMVRNFSQGEIERHQQLAQNLRMLVEMITDFDSYYTLIKGEPPTFLSFINQFDELITQYIDELEPEGLPDEDAVSIMTIHQAKGLEFPVVFVAGAIEGIIPSFTPEAQLLSSDEMEQLKEMFPHFHNPLPPDEDERLLEEKRLFYVAISRARDKLFLTWANRSGSLFNQPSRFLLNLNNNNSLSVKSCANAGLIYGENISLKSSQKLEQANEILSLLDLEYYLRTRDVENESKLLSHLAKNIASLGDIFGEKRRASYIPDIAYILRKRSYIIEPPWREAVKFRKGEPIFNPYMINNYLACPRKCFLESILRLKIGPFFTFRWRAVIRRIIALLNMPHRRKLYYALPVSELKREALDKLFPAVWKEMIPPPSSADEIYSMEKQRKDCFKILQSYLQYIYLLRDMKEDYLPPDEYRFSKEGLNFIVPVAGMLTHENGRIGIIEYNFSKKDRKSTEAQWMARKLLGYTKRSGEWVPPQDLRPIMYWWAIQLGENSLGEKPLTAPDFLKRYYLAVKNEENNSLPWAILGYPHFSPTDEDSYALSDTDIHKAESIIMECCQKIKKGQFPAQPSKNYEYTCEGYFGCPYDSLCRR